MTSLQRVLPELLGGVWKCRRVLESTDCGQEEQQPLHPPTAPPFPGQCSCVQFPGESLSQASWPAGRNEVLPRGPPEVGSCQPILGPLSRSCISLHLRCIFLDVAHLCTWGLHYLCSEFSSLSKILQWEPLPHPQTLTRASRGPFCRMVRFLESAWRSALSLELVYCGLRTLPWELWGAFSPVLRNLSLLVSSPPQFALHPLRHS